MTGTLPSETAVGRVALRVNDLDRLVGFYERVVGLAVQERTDERAVLGAGGQPLLVLLAAPEAGERGRYEAGLFHVAFNVPDRTALAHALRRLEERWDLGGASDHLVSEALYCTDPEGNGVEIYRDRPREEWPLAEDGSVEMDTLEADLAAIREAGEAGEVGLREREGVPPGTTVGHVHLEVSSLDDARAFYCERIGLNERARYGASALFLAAGEYHHHVGLNTWNGRTEPASGRGLAWWELVVPDEETLAAVRQRLAEGDEDGGLTVEDPDGIELRIRAADR